MGSGRGIVVEDGWKRGYIVVIEVHADGVVPPAFVERMLQS